MGVFVEGFQIQFWEVYLKSIFKAFNFKIQSALSIILSGKTFYQLQNAMSHTLLGPFQFWVTIFVVLIFEYKYKENKITS